MEEVKKATYIDELVEPLVRIEGIDFKLWLGLAPHLRRQMCVVRIQSVHDWGWNAQEFIGVALLQIALLDNYYTTFQTHQLVFLSIEIQLIVTYYVQKDRRFINHAIFIFSSCSYYCHIFLLQKENAKALSILVKCANHQTLQNSHHASVERLSMLDRGLGVLEDEGQLLQRGDGRTVRHVDHSADTTPLNYSNSFVGKPPLFIVLFSVIGRK